LQKALSVVVVVAAVALLAGCVGPTSYRAAGADGKPFGYSSSKLSKPIYRVRFQGNGRYSSGVLGDRRELPSVTRIYPTSP
jgi:hypothetical protein